MDDRGSLWDSAGDGSLPPDHTLGAAFLALAAQGVWSHAACGQRHGAFTQQRPGWDGNAGAVSRLTLRHGACPGQ